MRSLTSDLGSVLYTIPDFGLVVALLGMLRDLHHILPATKWHGKKSLGITIWRPKIVQKLPDIA